MYSRGIDMIHVKLRNAVLRRLLKQSIRSVNDLCKKHHCYIAVVGGVALERCVQGAPKAQRYLRQVIPEDIDIVFVVRHSLSGTSKEAVRRRVKRVSEIRDMFLQDLADRAQAWLDASANNEINQINQINETQNMRVAIDNSLSKVRAIEWARIISLVTIDGNGVQRTLLDTKILDQVAIREAHNNIVGVRNATRSVDVVPYNQVDGVKYATCEFVYHDTVRMLSERLEYFAQKRTVYALIKLYRHLLKFMSLYVLRNHVNGLPAAMMKIYKRVAQRLKTAAVLQKGLNNKEFRQWNYDEAYVNKVSKAVRDVVRIGEVQDLVDHFAKYKK